MSVPAIVPEMIEAGADDQERAAVVPTGPRLWATLTVGMALLCFILYVAGAVPLHPTIQRGTVLFALIVLTVLLYPMPGKARAWDVLVVIGSAVSIGYLMLYWKEMAYRSTFDPLWAEYILGFIIVIAVFDVTRRVVGWALPCVALACLLYAYLGNYLPEPFTHRGYSLARLLANQYFTHEGLFGSTLGIAIDVVAIFVLFGSLMQYVGLGDIMMRVAVRASGNSYGGPGKVAVIASALFGTISGSSTSNVVSTGTVTIPMMRRYGFRPEFAGATEACASTGGQLMPPVMGVAAFLMADVTGIPYATIVVAAIIPAILYYASLLMEVDLEARRVGLRGATERVTFGRSDRLKALLLLPIGVMVYYLMQGYAPARAAFLGIVLLAVLSLPMGRDLIDRARLKQFLLMFVSAMLIVGLSCAVAGIIVGALNITGSTLRLSYVIVELAGGQPILLLIGTAVLIIILGTGLPTPAAYAVGAAFAAPSLVLAGFEKMQAHMFILYFSCLSSITPPVAVAAYAAAALAGASPNRTGWMSFKLAIAGFIIPFMFVWTDSFFIGFDDWWSVIGALVIGLLGVALMAVAMIGFLGRPLTTVERLLYFAAATCFLDLSLWVGAIGLGLVAALLLVNFVLMRRTPQRELAGRSPLEIDAISAED